MDRSIAGLCGSASILAVAWAPGSLLGADGLGENIRAEDPDATLVAVGYQTAKLMNLGGIELAGPRPWTLELARWLLPILPATTAGPR